MTVISSCANFSDAQKGDVYIEGNNVYIKTLDMNDQNHPGWSSCWSRLLSSHSTASLDSFPELMQLRGDTYVVKADVIELKRNISVLLTVVDNLTSEVNELQTKVYGTALPLRPNTRKIDL